MAILRPLKFVILSSFTPSSFVISPMPWLARSSFVLAVALAAAASGVAALAQPPPPDPFQGRQPGPSGSYDPSIGGPPTVTVPPNFEGTPTATFQQPTSDREGTGSEQVVPITGEVFEPGEILATVGDQYILAADVLPHVNQLIEQHREQMDQAYGGKMPEEVLQQQRRMLLAKMTAAHVEVKILYLAFLRKIPPDRLTEILKKVQSSFDKDLEELRQRVEEMNDEKLGEMIRQDAQLGRLVLLMKEEGIWSPGELDALLRRYGGSLAQEKRYYAEYNLGRMIVRQSLNFEPEITHDDMLRYYQEHAADYEFPTRVRFEIMSVRFNAFPSKEAASQAICAMGNQVIYGAQFGAVAKASSQGLKADEGGLHDWTPRGTLVSKVIDEALFTIEPGKLSQILEDERGYHIIRVTERQEAGRIPFEETQVEIRKQIKEERLQKQYQEIAADLKKGTKITTAFDDDPLLSRAIRGDSPTRR
jgi:parvulin-like peptidyl-prolyl isomerase